MNPAEYICLVAYMTIMLCWVYSLNQRVCDLEGVLKSLWKNEKAPLTGKPRSVSQEGNNFQT